MPSITKHPRGWRAFVRRAGYPSQSRLFATKADAVRWAMDQEGRIARGERTPVGLRFTFADLLETYVERIGARGSRSKLLALTHVGKLLGDNRIDELRPSAFVKFAEARAEEGAGGATILMDLSYVGTVLRHTGPLLNAEAATAQALLSLAAARQSLRHVGAVHKSEERTRRPTDEELLALRDHWATKPRQVIPMWELTCFAIATAMRLGEITRLRRADYDPSTRTVLIRARKHPTEKKTNDQRVPLLVGHASVGGEIIDPNVLLLEHDFRHPPSSVSRSFERATQACGCPDLRFHDLRHHGVSLLFEYGYTIEQVGLCSGHRDWTNLKRYTNLRPESLHR